jgi:hypothetical protein
MRGRVAVGVTVGSRVLVGGVRDGVADLTGVGAAFETPKWETPSPKEMRVAVAVGRKVCVGSKVGLGVEMSVAVGTTVLVGVSVLVGDGTTVRVGI